MKIKTRIITLLITLILALFLFAGFCLESPSAMWVGIAKGQAGRGEYEEAIVSFNTALEKSPNSWYVYLNRGEFFLKIERYEEAAADLTRVVELYPKLNYIYKIYTERGDAYRMLGRHYDAIADYTTALSLRPNHAAALFGRGMSLAEVGRRTQALADLGRACGLKYEPACDAYGEIRARGGAGGTP
jgi:tetratricopeptide (TPR) repeat protein